MRQTDSYQSYFCHCVFAVRGVWESNLILPLGIRSGITKDLLRICYFSVLIPWGHRFLDSSSTWYLMSVWTLIFCWTNNLIKKEVTPSPTLYHRASHAWFDLSFHFTSFLPASLPQRHRRHFPSLMTLRVVLKFIWFSRFLLLITISHCLTPYNTLCKW